MATLNSGKRAKVILVYVVVAVALVILVMAMLLPPLDNRRERSPRAYCQSNLRRIGLAFMMYAETYGGRLPMDSDHPTLIGSLRLLSNIVLTAQVFHCPNDTRGKAESDYSKFTLSNISYSYVPGVIWQDGNADSIVALDRIYTTEKGSRWPANGNHKTDRGNILFNDGHVEFKKELPSALKDKTGKPVVLSP